VGCCVGCGTGRGRRFVNLGHVEEEAVRRFLSREEVVARVLEATAGDPVNLEAALALLPRSANELLLRRIEVGGEEARALLEVLAVRGRPMSPELLLRLAAQDRGEGGAQGRQVSALLEAGILRRKVSQGQMEVSFGEDRAWALLYEAIPEGRRQRLHGLVGALLLERREHGHQVEVEEVAAHFLRSDRSEEALRLALEAAERLYAGFAFERARQFLEQARGLTADAEALDEIEGRLIEIAQSLGEPKRALFYCGQLKKRRAAQGQASVYRRIGKILLGMGRYDLAERALARAVSLLGPEGARGEVVLALSLTAEALYGRGQYDRAVEVCQEGLSALSGVAAAEEADRLRAELNNTLGKVCLFREDYAQAASYFERNSALAQARGWLEERFRALFNLGTIAVSRRDYEGAEGIFLQCLSFGQRTANPLRRAFALMNLGVIYQQTQRYGEAIDHYLHALASFKKSGNDLQFAVTALNLADIYGVLGDLPKARALIEAALELTRAGEMRYFFARACSVRGQIALREGDAGAALGSFLEAREGSSNAGRTYRARITMHIARAHHALGQRQERDRWLEQVDRGDETAGGQELRGDFALYKAWMLADDGDFAGAEVEARQARALLASLGLLDRLWMADFQLGRSCRGLGRAGEARLHAQEAQRQVEALRARVPEALLERFDQTAEREALARLQRALERNGPFEEAELREALEASVEAEPAREPGPAVAAVRVGDPVAPGLRSWRRQFGAIVGEDARLHHLFRMVEKVASSDSTVLLNGESGTGKELFAELIHQRSARAQGPLVKVNCAAFVETLLLSELFGHEKGAFTGALHRKMGRFEMANGGTIFLDEIGDISSNTQVALLRVLQEREIERVGGAGAIGVDVRVVAATNRNLEEMVRQGSFRLDLYYRLKGVALELPALRERRGDIPLLVRHFTERYVEDEAVHRYFSHDALRLLAGYNWPGNIRELENFVRSMLLFVDEAVITEAHIREFGEFFAEGEMSAEPPTLAFAAGWWGSEEVEAVEVVEDGTEAAFAPLQVSGDARSALEEEEVVREGVLLSSLEGEGLERALIERVVTEGMSLQDLKHRLEIECIKRALLQTEGNITHAAALLQMKRPRLSQIINAHEELEELRRTLG
jgi:transcriptional regulator with GAF, ATPase, and Fis domain/predicted negative regulator of RcsB-dependent stress response